jgi:hypothetical protein
VFRRYPTVNVMLARLGVDPDRASAIAARHSTDESIQTFA